MTPDLPLYQGDPDAWQTYLAEGNRTQPRKRVSADVLFRDEAGRILLVDPRYKGELSIGRSVSLQPGCSLSITKWRSALPTVVLDPLTGRGPHR